MTSLLKKSWLWLASLAAVVALYFLYRKAAALRNELRLLQNVELKRKTELEEAQRVAQAESNQARLAQLRVELACLRGEVRARDEKLAAVEASIKIQTDQVLKAKSFAELEKILEESRKTEGPNQ